MKSMPVSLQDVYNILESVAPAIVANPRLLDPAEWRVTVI